MVEQTENKKIHNLKLANERRRKSTTEPQNYIVTEEIPIKVSRLAQNFIKKEFQNSLQLQLNSSNFSPLANMDYKPVNGTNAPKPDAESEQREKGLKTALNSTN